MSRVAGAGDIERKYEYWIEFGAREERERILTILDQNADAVPVNWLIALINKSVTVETRSDSEIEQIWSDVLGSGWEDSDWFLNIKYDGGNWDKPCNAKLKHFSKDDETVVVVTEFTPAMLLSAYDKLVREKYMHCGGCGMDDPDYCTSDAVLQYMVYGDLIYG